MSRHWLRIVAIAWAVLASGGVSFADGKTVRVSADGSGDHRTVQAAINAIPAGGRDRVVISIKPGVYKERIRVTRDKGPVTIRGEGKIPAETVLTFNYSAKSIDNGKEVGTSGSYSTLIEAADFVAENLTFENSAGDVGQAVALRTTGDRAAFRNCRFLGWQDTLYTHDGALLLRGLLHRGAGRFHLRPLDGGLRPLRDSQQERRLRHGRRDAAGIEVRLRLPRLQADRRG